MSARVLIIGAGGREHALAWKLAKSPLLDHIFVCPGNAGTSQEPKSSNVEDIAPEDFLRLVEFALKNEVCLVNPFRFFMLRFIYLDHACSPRS
jgi:phosphoribosylamine--glycine ligase/phosphoribosylformylglycinamidine cyclo-ligase